VRRRRRRKKNMISIYLMEYYSIFKMKEILKHATSIMNLENFMVMK
jgi:hypothetical protein